MGTRADFYIKKQNKMKWLGSIAWDGMPKRIDPEVLNSTSQQDFIVKLGEFFNKRDDATLPKDGWPWPWNDSNTTDYAYIFENNKVMASCFGEPLFDPLLPEPETNIIGEIINFPNMSKKKKVTFGKRSGLIVI